MAVKNDKIIYSFWSKKRPRDDDDDDDDDDDRDVSSRRRVGRLWRRRSDKDDDDDDDDDTRGRRENHASGVVCATRNDVDPRRRENVHVAHRMQSNGESDADSAKALSNEREQ